MEYFIDVEERVRGKISNRCKLEIINEVYYGLDSEHQQKFTDSCFGHLLSVAEIKISLQIIHQCIVRAVRTLKENEVWCKFGNKIARFGLEEFVLITGLKAGELESEDENLGLQSDLIQKYFKKSKGKVVRKQLLIAFRRCGNQADKFKMGLLLMLAYVLLSAEENTSLNLWWFHVVDNFDRFNSYAWGKRSYEYTRGIFNQIKGETVKKYERNERYPYNFHGFPLAIMIWAFEAIPGLGKQFAHRLEGDRIPRMSGWDFQQTKLDGETVSKFLDTDIQIMQLMVKRTLVPSQEEAEEEFYQGMTPLDDVEDSRVDKSLDEDGIEESEEDEPSVPMHQPPRDRPSSSHDNNVVEVVRQEMRELESRLVRVINGRCDHIEAKLDRLLKLVGSGASQPQGGEFQSDKSGFHSETRRFHTYSPQHEDNIPEENKGREEDCVFEAAVEKSVNVEEQVTPIQGEGRRGSTGQGMLSNPSTAIVVYREMPRILIPDSKHRLGEQEPVDVVMSNQPEQSAESCPKDQVGESSTILLEDETDEESPKGRGQRKRRKGKALRTPWTNPLKRRKFKNVTVYDPFREVDPAKVSDLKEWMEKASPRDAVALAICDAGRTFFEDLHDQIRWLTGDHVDSALFHIRERAVKYANLFRQDCAVLDSNFWQIVENAFEDRLNTGRKNSDDAFKKMLVDYVEGAAPVLGKPWKTCRYLYLPYCVPNSHWFAVEIDLQERQIHIFDSLTSMVREAKLGNYMKPLKVVVPRLMKKYVNDNYSTSMFTHHRSKKLPVQDNGSDCGLFTVKFIEFSLASLDLNLVQPKHMLMWRQKMAAEIFAGEFDP
ncbi:Ulp1 protease family protein [Abeliophyllum distichum]|uniref:Ulp1 protease family protein n=1 Tax=Abeliophyllum distichum TaxID=126358 RepID=A0ABD1NY14_9LAMI